MVSAIALLVKAGLSTRRQHHEDGRATLLELTERGHGMVEAAVPILHRCNRHATHGISDESQAELIRTMRAIIANIEPIKPA